MVWFFAGRVYCSCLPCSHVVMRMDTLECLKKQLHDYGDYIGNRAVAEYLMQTYKKEPADLSRGQV